VHTVCPRPGQRRDVVKLSMRTDKGFVQQVYKNSHKREALSKEQLVDISTSIPIFDTTMAWDLLDPQPELTWKETVALKRSTASFSSPVAKIKTCVYETNCSELYKVIEKERWSDVAHFLDSSSWSVSGFSIIPDWSPRQQALTLVHQLDEDDDKVIWSLLPIHLAILRRAPFPIIGRLIDLAPQALTIPDHKGNLALHYAMTVPASDEALAYVLANSPESIAFTNSKGLTPLQCALASKEKRANHLGRMVQLFLEHYGRPKARISVKKPEVVCEEPSPLYLGIQHKDWESVLHFLKMGKWPSNWIIGLFDSLLNADDGNKALEEQVKAMVERKDENGDLVRALLPIHLAIIYGAPLDIVRQLVNMYPQSLRVPDNQGMLPLHLALYQNSSEGVIVHLLEGFPESAGIKGLHGQYSPIEIAFEGNEARAEILQHFLLAKKQHAHLSTGTVGEAPKE